jgi:hypothetical protein
MSSCIFATSEDLMATRKSGKRMKGGHVSSETTASFRAAARKLKRAAAALDPVMGHGLYAIAEEIMTDIKDAVPGKGVPVDEGTLRDSGKVMLDGPLGGSHTSVYLTFGGAAAPYALIQHENLQYKHPIGEARYMVRGIERWSPTTSGAWAVLQSSAQAAVRRVGRGPNP